MKIYITRHGETEWNREKRMQGRKDSPLTVKGIEDARRLKQRLEHIEFDGIYTSPLGRAMETAEIIRGHRKLEIERISDFMEMDFGDWEGRTVEEIEKSYGEKYRTFWHRPEMYETIGGESFQEMLKRVQGGLNLIIKNAEKEDNILLVAHAVVIKSIYALVKNIPLKEFWNPPFMHGTNLTILEVKKDKKEFLLEGDISHLKK